MAGIGSFFRSLLKIIDEHKIAKEELRESQERLQLVLDATSDGFFDWNLKMNSIFFKSPDVYTMLGYENNEFYSGYDSYMKLVHPEDRSKAEKIIEDYFAGKKTHFSFEFRVKSKSGAWFWIRKQRENRRI